MKKNKTLIDKPIINYISKEELDAIVPMMSGGGGGGGTIVDPLDVFNFAYIVFSPLDVPGLGWVTDHVSLIVGKKNGKCYYYAFGASASDLFGFLCTGTDGFLCSAVQYKSNRNSSEIASSALISTSSIRNDSGIIIDSIDDRRGAIKSGFDKWIKIPITNLEGISLCGYANEFRYATNENHKSSGSVSMRFGISVIYQLFLNNCYDIASELLELIGYTIEYDKSKNISRMLSLANFIYAINPLLGAEVLGYVAGISAAGGKIPNLPDCVYDGFANVKKNNSIVSGAVKEEF